ncbi:MAG: hypothetical protein QW812_00895 [Thermoplasmataceae archaeon]
MFFLIDSSATLMLNAESLSSIANDINTGSSVFKNIRDGAIEAVTADHVNTVENSAIEITGNRLSVTCSIRSGEIKAGAAAALDFVFRICSGIIMHYFPYGDKTSTEITSIRDIHISEIRRSQKD